MVYALLAPKAMTAWALRQYLGARFISKNYNKTMGIGEIDARRKLELKTYLHGFFLQMGGSLLAENGVPVQTLTEGGPKSTQLISYIEEKIIDIPRITEDVIKGRSKGEPFSEAIIILQTTWFIVRCVARWSQGLAVTELEVVTLGFAVLNGLTYGLWWHKPQNV
ncbi:hypothetical protein BDN70DRAFT_959151, partial [Pholiota conissans]